jgi:WD40 repeat protein
MRWFLVLALSILPAVAQLQLRVVSPVDSTQYPLLSVIAESRLDGVPTALDDGTIALASSRYTIRPQNVETLDHARGRIRITWLADPRLATENFVHIFAWNGEQLARDSVRLPRLPVLRIVTQQSTPLEELAIRAEPSIETTERFYLQLFTGRYSTDGTRELPIRVDSIVSSIPFVQVEWVGWAGGSRTLPSLVYSPLLYLVRLHCAPPDTTYRSGTITIYYDSSLSLAIPISVNRFPIPATQQLRFEWPTGGELLAPCQPVTLRWSGMALDARVAVDYSLDSGTTWEPITITTESSTTWTVPNAPTRGLRFRLRQLDGQQRTYRLDDLSTTAVGRITFRSDGKRLLAFHAINGELVEWDVGSRQITWRALPPDVGQVQPVWVAYLDSMRAIAVYNASARGYAALFRIGAPTPLWSGQIFPTTIGRVALDTAHHTLALIASISPTLRLLEISDSTIASARSVPLPFPATALTISGSEALVALLDSRIARYQTPQWTPIGEYTLPFLPHVALMSALPDGRRLAIGCSVSQPSVVQGLSAPVFVFDRPTAQVIRSYRQAASPPVALTASGNGRYLAIGFRGQPQSPLWDLAVDMITGQVSTHQGALADIAFSPDQRMVASSSATSPLELVLRSFLFPETVISQPIRIGALALATDTLDFPPTYAYAGLDTTFRARLCNRGEVPIPLSEHWAEGEPAFQLLDISGSDTLQPGECRDVTLRFAPGRAGDYRGAVVIRHCDQLLRLPLRGRALERTVSYPDTIAVGTACVGSPVRAQFIVLMNEDPAPLPIGGATIYDGLRSPFRLVAPPHDTIIGGKSALVLTIEFSPNQSGNASGTLYVNYGWRDYTATITLSGMGIGGTVEPHVRPLPFVPEQPLRMLRLRNRERSTLTITGARVEPTGGFRIIGDFPLAIPPHDSVAIGIEWLQTDSSGAELVLQLEPCSSTLRIPLVRFQAHAELRIPTVRADVHGRARIPILARVAANTDYGDRLPCTLRIAMHPRLLMPDTAWSPGGTAKLLSRGRLDDRRIATIALERALVLFREDTLAVLEGAAALGEQDTSHLDFADAPYWGTAVAITTTRGILELEGFCGDRRTIEEQSLRMTIVPTPASGTTITVAIESRARSRGELVIYSARGEERYRTHVRLDSGKQDVPISIADLEAGIYAVVLTADGYAARATLVVVR